MKDKNGIEIKVGDLVKRCGFVQYADGLKYKLSKKTWRISKIEGDTLFYADEYGNNSELRRPANEGDFIVVNEESTPVPFVRPSGVPHKYRVHVDYGKKNWKIGDIVLIYGQVGEETLKSGKLERVPDSEEHKHVLIIVDPLQVLGNANSNVAGI